MAKRGRKGISTPKTKQSGSAKGKRSYLGLARWLAGFKVNRSDVYGFMLTFMGLVMVVLSNFAYALGDLRIVFNILFAGVLAYVFLVALIIVYRRGTISFVAYRWYWLLVLLFVGLVISTYEGLVFRVTHSMVDLFMYLSYHPAFWVISSLGALAVMVALYSSSFTLDRFMVWVSYSVVLIDVILVVGAGILRLVDLPNGSGFIKDITTNLGVALGSWRTAVLLPWGDVGTFVLTHLIALVVLTERFGGFAKKVNVSQVFRLLSIMFASALVWFLVWRFISVAIFVLGGGIALLSVLLFRYRKHKLVLLHILYWLLFYVVVGASIYVIVGVDWSIAALKEFVNSQFKGVFTLVLNWFTKYETADQVLNGLLPAPVMGYLFGIGVYHSGFVLPILSFGSPYTRYVAPVVRYLIEFGVINTLLLASIVLSSLFLVIRYGVANLKALLLLGLAVIYTFLFYPSLASWFMLTLVLFYFYEAYAPHYRGVWNFGIYTKGARGQVVNHTKHIFGGLIVIVLLLTFVIAFKLTKAIVMVQNITNTTQEFKNIDSTEARVEKMGELDRQLRRFRQSCGDCILANVLFTDSYISFLDKVNLKDSKDKELSKQVSEIIVLAYGESYRLQHTLPTPPLLYLLANGYARLYELTKSEFYWRLAADYYGRYIIFIPDDIQVALRYARLLVDGITPENSKVYEPRLAAVLQIIEGTGFNVYQSQGNIGLLWEATNIRAYYLAKLGRYTDARNLYIKFKQFVQNSVLPEEQKSQLVRIVDRIIRELDKGEVKEGNTTAAEGRSSTQTNDNGVKEEKE